MTFEEAGQRFTQLRAQLESGQITEAQYAEAVNQLQVQDEAGTWWQLDPNSGSWLRWNGSIWESIESSASAAQSQPAATQPASSTGGSSSKADHAPVGVAPVGWGQIVWDIITLGGCGAMAAVWYWYSGMAETAPDTKTCVTMVALPFALMVLRPWTDRLLLKLQPHITKIPRMVLLGLGLAIPFLVANQLYGRYTEFEYLFRTIVISTLLTYVLFRTPLVRPKSTGKNPTPGGTR
ncbi:MAG: hypothetical protein JSU96_01745 [Acidobacteriota bacterium]|nr:MAG: hypothetical protein JSU96_01745 [Acidobacteriota bacterium]